MLVSTSIIFALGALLAVILTINYGRNKMQSLIYWSAGMYVFSASVALEILFSLGMYGQFLIKAYLFLVAVLVELLATGSILLLRKKALINAYAIYGILSTAFLAYALISSVIGNVITGGVVYGALPVLVDAGSAIITAPAALILVVVSALSYRSKRDAKLLSIIAGVVVVSIAGTLYIAAFPAFLYYAEFVGILLLWLGFVDFKAVLRKGDANKSKALD